MHIYVLVFRSSFKDEVIFSAEFWRTPRDWKFRLRHFDLNFGLVMISDFHIYFYHGEGFFSTFMTFKNIYYHIVQAPLQKKNRLGTKTLPVLGQGYVSPRHYL